MTLSTHKKRCRLAILNPRAKLWERAWEKLRWLAAMRPIPKLSYDWSKRSRGQIFIVLAPIGGFGCKILSVFRRILHVFCLHNGVNNSWSSITYISRSTAKQRFQKTVKIVFFRCEIRRWNISEIECKPCSDWTRAAACAVRTRLWGEICHARSQSFALGSRMSAGYFMKQLKYHTRWGCKE